MKWVKETVGYWCPDIVEEGWLGQNVGVAVLDTGIAQHPDFDGRIKGFLDCVNHRRTVYDDSGHGTHVCGILAGSGKLSNGIYAGIAPRAHIFMAKVLDQSGNGCVESVLDGIGWVLSRKDADHIRIVNISVGTQPGVKSKDERRLLDGVEALWDAGLVVVVSAGNYGPAPGTVAVPGSSRKVITVGAVDIVNGLGRTGKEKWNYSGRGPTKNCVIKPDLVAPGTYIVSCRSSYGARFAPPYAVKSGTSMATPVVSGAIACLLSKYPDMTNVEVKLKLRTSCVAGESEDAGWGMLNVQRLLSP